MNFIKYRNKFASGYGDWLYREYPYPVDNTEEIKEWVENEIEDEYAWSDKYRGCEYEFIDKPPSEWLKNKIYSCDNNIKYYTNLKKELTELL